MSGQPDHVGRRPCEQTDAEGRVLRRGRRGDRRHDQGTARDGGFGPPVRPGRRRHHLPRLQGRNGVPEHERRMRRLPLFDRDLEATGVQNLLRPLPFLPVEAVESVWIRKRVEARKPAWRARASFASSSASFSLYRFSIFLTPVWFLDRITGVIPTCRSDLVDAVTAAAHPRSRTESQDAGRRPR